MSSRGIETREKLVETALRLFRDEGFAATTMRKIANEAEVSLGNAYYYFASKDELVHELYLVIQRDHRARALQLGPRAAGLRAVAARRYQEPARLRRGGGRPLRGLAGLARSWRTGRRRRMLPERRA